MHFSKSLSKEELKNHSIENKADLNEGILYFYNLAYIIKPWKKLYEIIVL